MSGFLSEKMGLRAWVAEAIVLVGYAALAVAETGIASDLSQRCYGGGGGDPGQDVGIVYWVSGHLLDAKNIFEGKMFYPSHHSVLFAEPLLGPALLVAPLRLFTRDPVLLYNVAVLSVLWTASWGFYRLAIDLFRDRPAALLAGIVIPYTGQQMAHVWHLNLLTISFFPFLTLGLLRLLERPRLRWALLAGAAFGLEADTCGYHGFSCLFLALCVAAWGWRRFRRRETWAYCAAAGLAAAIIVSPRAFGVVHLTAHEGGLKRGVGEQAHYSLKFPKSFLVSHSYVWGGLHAGEASWRGFKWAYGLTPVFPGLTVLVLAVAALRHVRTDRHVQLLAVLVPVFALLALGPRMWIFGHVVHSPPFWLLRQHLPFFTIVRHPRTFVVPALMALGLLASAGLHLSGLSRSRVATMLVLLAGALETLGPRHARGLVQRELPEVYRYLQRQPPGALLELPHGGWGAEDDRPDPLDPGARGGPRWWTIFHGMPIVNGAGAFGTQAYTVLVRWIVREWAGPGPLDLSGSKSVELLKERFPARYLVVYRDVYDVVRENIAATSGTFEFLHESPEGDRVYRIHRGGAGRSLVREFREDQLMAGRISATLRGKAGGVLSVRFNGAVLEERTMEGEWTEARWQVPGNLVRYGMNELRLEAGGNSSGGGVELQDVEAE